MPLSSTADSEAGAAGTPGPAALAGMGPGVDWELGLLPRGSAAAAEAGEAGSQPAATPGSAAALHATLGKLYAMARSELTRLGEEFGLQSGAGGSPALPVGALPGAAGLPSTAAEAATPGTRRARGVAGVATPGTQQQPQQPSDAEAAMASSYSAADLSAVSGGLQAIDLGSLTPGSEQQEVALGAQTADAAAPGSDSAADSMGGGLEAASLASESTRLSPLSQGRAPSGPAGEEALLVTRRLSVRVKGPGEADSAPSSPHSTGTASRASSSSPMRSQAESRASSAPPQPQPQAAAAAAAHRAPPLARPSPQRGAAAAVVDQSDPRLVERQVATPALGSRYGSPATLFAWGRRASSGTEGGVPQARPGAPLALPDRHSTAGGRLPDWLVHWRLRLALASQAAFSELWAELSDAAARCFAQCGRRRAAAVLYADVADALAVRGQLAQAAALYERQCRAFLRDGWYALAARTLPKLAACQVALGGAGLPYTAAALLALPPGSWASASGTPDPAAACLLLLQAARRPDALQGMRPLLGVAPPDGHLHLWPLLAATPVLGAYSRFFGQSDAAGSPLLQATGPGGIGGAALACVGDVVLLRLAVHSALPVELPLADAVLTLAVLQELTGGHGTGAWLACGCRRRRCLQVDRQGPAPPVDSPPTTPSPSDVLAPFFRCRADAVRCHQARRRACGGRAAAAAARFGLLGRGQRQRRTVGDCCCSSAAH